jgi:hypothetical protein
VILETTGAFFAKQPAQAWVDLYSIGLTQAGRDLGRQRRIGRRTWRACGREAAALMT